MKGSSAELGARFAELTVGMLLIWICSTRAIAYECRTDARSPVREYRLTRIDSDTGSSDAEWPVEATLRVVGAGRIEFGPRPDNENGPEFSAVLQ